MHEIGNHLSILFEDHFIYYEREVGNHLSIPFEDHFI
jgi:hypothetical protein